MTRAAPLLVVGCAIAAMALQQHLKRLDKLARLATLTAENTIATHRRVNTLERWAWGNDGPPARFR